MSVFASIFPVSLSADAQHSFAKTWSLLLYRFLCALQPSQREAWAKTWAQLIAPDGHLVTTIFPVDSERTGGPPFPVTPEIYAQLLQPVGETYLPS